MQTTHYKGFQPKKGNSLSIKLIQSVLDKQLLFNVTLLNSTSVFLFRTPPKYDNLSHFVSITNPSDQYNNKNY